MEVDEFNFAVKIFNQSRATFNPIAAIQILHAADGFYFRAMDVTADDAVGLMTARHRSECVFVFGDKFYGGFGFGFQKRGE